MDGKRTLGRIALVGSLIGVELYLARGLTSRAAVPGYTATSSYSIAPPRAARVREVAATLGTSVKAGDVIARLDTTDVDNELEIASAERRIAAAALVAETARLRRDSLTLTRRFSTYSERATADLASAEASAHTAAAELAAVDAELVEQTDLVSKHLADASILRTLQLRRAALAKQVDAASNVLGVLRGNANAAKGRMGETEGGADDQLAPLQARLQAADLKIAQLGREREGLTLRAPADGVIDLLPLHAGDLAAPQTPVATLVAPDARRVVTCIPEARASGIEPGLEADITSTVDRVETTGEVESITGTIGPLPPRCQPPGSKIQLMGRVAIITLDEPAGGLPGQTQMVRFSARRRPRQRPVDPPPAPPPADAAAAVDGPALLAVPKELADDRLEPSGIVWMPALDRFVIVSDDTGPRSGNGHPPWLFTMSADGKLDPAPLVVTGVDELDDLESITTDGKDGLWVLASLSTSQRGKRPASRRRLAHLAIDKSGAVRADQVIDLGGMLDGSAPAVRASLGVDDARVLDIEGMTSHAGALYLGLKAPLDGNRHAIIWKIATPAKLASGDLEAAGISRWATLAMTVDADGRSVPGGIADLMFWDDDTLVVSATASGIDAKDQDGAIYVGRPAPGEIALRRIRTFSSEKPEGLARGPKGSLVVVFDRGNKPPMWTQLPESALRTGAKQ